MSQELSIEDVRVMGLFDLLGIVFGNSSVVLVGPNTRKKDGETERSVIKNPVTHRLYGFMSVLQGIAEHSRRAHINLHQAGGHVCEADCMIDSKKTFRLKRRAMILKELFWQSVYEEFPLAASNGCGVRSEWRLVSTEDEWNDVISQPEPTSILNTCTAVFANIINKKHVYSRGDDLIAPNESEEYISTITDTRIQTIWFFINEVFSEMKINVPACVINQDERAMGDLSFREVKRLQQLLREYSNLAKLCGNLFWCGVSDSLPFEFEGDDINVRSGWTVFRKEHDTDIPKEIQEALGTMIRDLFGPFIKKMSSEPLDLSGEDSESESD